MEIFARRSRGLHFDRRNRARVCVACTDAPVGYVLACAASGGICLALAVMRGHPRPYTLIPLFLAAVACSLEAVFSPAVKSLNREQRLVIVRGRPIMRYFSSQLEYARIGPTPEDEYMSWVREIGVNRIRQLVGVSSMPERLLSIPCFRQFVWAAV